MKKYWIIGLTATLLAGCAYTVDKSQFGNLNKAVINTPQVQSANLNIGVEKKELLDHDAKLLGVMCSAFDYHVSLSKDIEERLAEVDKNGVLDDPQMSDVKLVASSSRTTLKCIQTGVVSGKCQADVRVAGSVVSKDGNTESFNIEKTKIYASGMELSSQPNAPISICEGASWAIYKANSEVVDGIIEMIRARDI